MVAFTTAALAGAVLALGTTASAHHFSGATGATGCTNLNMADNRDHGYHYYQLKPRPRSAMSWTRSTNMNPTTIDTRSAPLTARTDVIVLDRYYEAPQV